MAREETRLRNLCRVGRGGEGRRQDLTEERSRGPKEKGRGVVLTRQGEPSAPTQAAAGAKGPTIEAEEATEEKAEITLIELLDLVTSSPGEFAGVIPDDRMGR